MKRLAILAAALISTGPLSCGRGVYLVPAGSYSNVIVVTETGKPGDLNDEIIRVLQHVIDYYTKEEIQFKLRMVAAADFEKEEPAKNVVFYGLVRQGAMGGMIERFIGTNAVRTVLEGKNHIFKKIDFPTNGQLTVIVTASTSEQLREVARRNGETIREIIEEANRERLRENLLLKENAAAAAELKARYDFSIRIPEDYRVNRDWEQLPGVEILRDYPHRGITVSWFPWEKRSLTRADSTELYQRRSRIVWEIHDKEVMRPELVDWRSGTLGPYDAIRLDGYWESSEEMYGGPFICFFIHDRVRSRVWLVDCLVYAPGFDKHELLRETWSVAETFRIK